MDRHALAVRTAQWRQIISECNNSPLCKSEWCRNNGIRLRSFMYWQKKFRDEDNRSRSTVITTAASDNTVTTVMNRPVVVDVTDRISPDGSSADEGARNTSADPGIVIQAGNYQVFVHGLVQEEPLRTVMKVLRDV